MAKIELLQEEEKEIKAAKDIHISMVNKKFSGYFINIYLLSHIGFSGFR